MTRCNTVRMNDQAIRQLLLKHLARRKWFVREHFAEEVSLQNGLVRADVVVCSNRLECFEIKSKSDTLKRLVPQGWQYGQSFDHVNLVCATKHLLKAQDLVPDWWGLYEVTDCGKLRLIRRASKNPEVSVAGMVDILQNSESIELLCKMGINRSVKSLSHNMLRNIIDENLSITEVRDWVKTCLQKRNAQAHLPKNAPRAIEVTAYAKQWSSEVVGTL